MERGGEGVLEPVERPAPEPGSREILVRVEATAVNRADLLQRRGLYPEPPGAPADIPGLEYAGVVARIASDVSEWAVGDRVMGLVGGGSYAEYVAVQRAKRSRCRRTWARAAEAHELLERNATVGKVVLEVSAAM